MKAKFSFLIILSVLCCNKNWGQFTALNSYYQLGKTTKFLDVLYSNDSLTIIAEIFHPDSTNLKNPCIIRSDTIGNFSKLKVLYDPFGNSPNLISENVKLTKTKDNGFVFTSGPFNKISSLFLYKLKENLEIDFVKEYDLGKCNVYDVKVLETASAYFIGLDVCTNNGNDHDYCVIKTDLQGNKLWHKFYGNEERYEILTNIKSFKEDELTLLGNKGLSNDQGRAAITTIDTSGNVTKEIFNIGDGEGSINDFDMMDNGDFIYVATKWIDIPNYIGSLRIYRIDGTGKVIWKKVINENVHNPRLHRMHRNTDGSYTIIGKEEGKGRSLCITQDGEVLWQHIYKLPTSPMPIQYYSGLLGMTALPSGSIISCGYFRDLSDQTYEEQGWLVRMDANGCIEENCKTLLSSREEILPDRANVSVYPNPNNGQFKVNLPADATTEVCSITFYNIVGNRILNKLLSPGINQVELNTKGINGVLIYRIVTEKGDLIKLGKLIITK